MTASPMRRLLAPLVTVYRLGLALRERQLRSGREPVRRLRWPVVSVGSLSAGGAGKTPMTIALAKALTARGFYVDVLSRGYGRKSRDAARVRPDGTAEEFGDEPLLIAQQAGVPVYVAAERFEAGQLAEANHEDETKLPGRPALHLLDDGFQHRQLSRDVDILLADRGDWSDRLLPAGNLRESLRAAERADVIAIPADDPAFEQELREWGWRGPVWRVRRVMDVRQVPGPVVAFCGIARPQQFFAGLERAGVAMAARMAFADHHRYSARDITRIRAAAHKAQAAELITTEKDYVRLGDSAVDLCAGMKLSIASLRAEIEEEAVDWLADRLRSLWSSLNQASQ